MLLMISEYGNEIKDARNEQERNRFIELGFKDYTEDIPNVPKNRKRGTKGDSAKNDKD